VFPAFKPNSFHALLAVTENGEVIRDSNSYIDDCIRYQVHYEIENKIYARINVSYDMLTRYPSVTTVDQEVCYAMTPFDSVNFGHNLSILFDLVHKYRVHNLSCPLVFSERSKQFPNILTLARLFFPSLVFVENNVIMEFRSIHIFEPVILDIHRHKDIIEECRSLALAKVGDLERFKNKKIFMPKLSTKNANITKRSTALRAKVWLEILAENPEWVYINPEEMDICEIIAYLTYANTIVTSTGSICYGHAIFYSTIASWFFLFNGTHDSGIIDYLKERYIKVRCTENLDDCIDILRGTLNV